jgi:hypothetical protein
VIRYGFVFRVKKKRHSTKTAGSVDSGKRRSEGWSALNGFELLIVRLSRQHENKAERRKLNAPQASITTEYFKLTAIVTRDMSKK